MSKHSKRLYEFGSFQLEAENSLLLRNGVPVPLKPKVCDTLLILVQERGRLISKDELMQRIWGDTAVEENNLTQNISILRKTLGESATGQKYIETIPKRGYRFIASVQEVIEQEQELVIERHNRTRLVIEQENGGATVISPRRVWQALVSSRLSQATLKQKALVVFALLLVLSAALYWVRPRPQEPDWRSSLRLSTIAGLKSERQESLKSGRLSPDKSLIAYCSYGDGVNIYVMQVDSGHPVQVTTGKWHDTSPIWSPNGREIAFLSDRGNQLGIWKTPYLGGAITPVKILEPDTTVLKNGPASLIHWSRKDDKRIYYKRDHNLFALDTDSGKITQLTSFEPSGKTPEDFGLSPDEEEISYVDLKDGQYDIWSVPVGGGTPVQITNDPVVEQYPVWIPGGDGLIYSSVVDGRFGIYIAHLDGRQPEPIYFSDDNGQVWDIASDGSRVLYYGKRNESDVWQVNVTTGEESRLTSNISMEFWPDVSPDGESIVFQSIPGIAWDPRKSSLLVRPAATSTLGIEIVNDGFQAHWSPAGDVIYYGKQSSWNLLTMMHNLK